MDLPHFFGKFPLACYGTCLDRRKRMTWPMVFPTTGCHNLASPMPSCQVCALGFLEWCGWQLFGMRSPLCWGHLWWWCHCPSAYVCVAVFVKICVFIPVYIYILYTYIHIIRYIVTYIYNIYIHTINK